MLAAAEVEWGGSEGVHLPRRQCSPSDQNAVRNHNGRVRLRPDSHPTNLTTVLLAAGLRLDCWLVNPTGTLSRQSVNPRHQVRLADAALDQVLSSLRSDGQGWVVS